MSKNSLKLKIAYLYSDILQSFCDDFNVETFCKRAKWRDIDVQVTYINANDRITSSKYDFYYIGGSNLDKIDNARKALSRNEDILKVAAVSCVPMLAINCGYLLFGNFYQLPNATPSNGLKILDVDSMPSKKPNFGSVSGVCKFLKNKTIVGYKNHIMTSYLKTDSTPFVFLDSNLKNDAASKTEGARFNNVIGTYITSPILAQNPHLCDFYIANSLRIKYKSKIPLTSLCDDIEWYSHKHMLEN